MESNQPNFGYSFEQEEKDKQPEDYQFGSGNFEKIKYDNLIDYRSDGEIQRSPRVESFMCVLFSFCKCVAYRMNWRMVHEMGIEERAWLEQNKFIKNKKFNPSELFLGILANVTRGQGTSMKNGVETAKRVGLISEFFFPFRINAKTWEELTEPPTEKQKETALKFLDRYKFWYENVSPNIRKMRKALEYGPLWVAGSAWHNKQANGIYPKVSYRANHCFVVDNYIEIEGPNNDYWEAPDSYPTNDGSFIKRLAWNYKFWAIKQVEIEYLIKNETSAWSAPANGEIDGKKFEKGTHLSFKSMWNAVFTFFKGLGK